MQSSRVVRIIADAVSTEEIQGLQAGGAESSPSATGAPPASPETPQQWPTGESSATSTVHNGVSATASLNGSSENGAAPPSGMFSGALNTYDSGGGKFPCSHAIEMPNIAPFRHILWVWRVYLLGRNFNTC